jgi:hypothetical protein
MPIVIAWLCTGAAFCTSGDCASADAIRLAVQKTGTVFWELDAMRAHHQLDTGRHHKSDSWALATQTPSSPTSLGWWAHER